jgi:hypothetical protein
MEAKMVTSDTVRWYNVGKFGEAGYAVPAWGNDISTLNPNIAELTDLIGQNLFALLHQEDADMHTPPSVNTLRAVHRLYVRAGQILTARAVPSGQTEFRTTHVSPAATVFKVYPIPFFKMRNPHLKRWASLGLMLLSEMFQHTENRKTMEITSTFAADVGKYLTRIYYNMATELFAKPAADVAKPGFILTDADFTAYDPSFFTRVELVSTVSPFDMVFTEDQLATLRQGIPVTMLPQLPTWPGLLIPGDFSGPTGGTVGGSGTGPVFPAPTVGV